MNTGVWLIATGVLVLDVLVARQVRTEWLRYKRRRAYVRMLNSYAMGMLQVSAAMPAMAMAAGQAVVAFRDFAASMEQVQRTLAETPARDLLALRTDVRLANTVTKPGPLVVPPS